MKEDRKNTRNVAVVKHSEPKIKLPPIAIDNKLHKKLDKIELMSCLNHGFCMMGIGVPGSGKTSTIASWLGSKQLFHKVFDKIYLFMPENSFQTMRKSVLASIPEKQVYHNLDVSSIEDVMKTLRKNAKNELNSLVIFDDVQEYLKDHKIMRELGTMNANRRHLRTSIYFAVQYYKKVPKNTRAIASHLMCFNVSEEDLKFMNKEAIGEKDDVWDEIVGIFKHKQKEAARNGSKRFLCIDLQRKRYFVSWDEIIVKDDDYNDEYENSSDEESIEKSDKLKHKHRKS